jgi:hypothetical protein
MHNSGSPCAQGHMSQVDVMTTRIDKACLLLAAAILATVGDLQFLDNLGLLNLLQ